MKTLTVQPHIGIGLLKLGMSPEDILMAIKQTISELPLSENSSLQISRDSIDEVNAFTLRYQKDAMFFMVHYKNNQAIEISVDRGFNQYASVTLFDLDIFETKADSLISSVKQFSPCIYDCEDEELSTEYTFPSIGVRFWREEPFHLKLLSDKKYMDTMAIVIDDMCRYLYFDIVTVK